MSDVNIMSTNHPILFNWSIEQINTGDIRYQAPELHKIGIQGKIYNHPKFKDNTEILTTYIIHVDGKIITTMSGTKYYIEGPPSKDYQYYCNKHKIVIDENNPIKLIKRFDYN
jgi:hypothetical protein